MDRVCVGGVITLDSSGIFALLNRSDPDHEITATSLSRDSGPYIVPAGILAEVAYLVERRLGTDALESFILDIESGGFTLECGEEDLPRIRELVRKYEDFPLGFADASVVACSERVSGRGGKVLTLDRRHFDVLARDVGIVVVP